MHRHLFLILLTLTPLALASCDRPSDAPLAQFRLGYFANLTHAQAVLAVSSGELAQALSPLPVTTRVFNAGPALIQALFAGEIDIGYVGPGPVLAASERTKGRGIRVIAGAAANGVVIVARDDAPIHSLQDLAGKKIATPQHGNTQDIAARHYLQFTLNQTDLGNVIPISNAEQPAMMARGQIDAAWVPEPWGARLIAENNARLIAEEKDLWPGQRFALTVVVTTPEFLAAHPDVVEKFLAVHSTWTRRLQTAPADHAPQLAQSLLSLTGKSLPPGVPQAALARTQFTTDPLPSTFATMSQWSHDLNFLKREPRTDHLIDTSILQTLESTPTTQPN
jgi:NitT/TauT family transport system substrate-binding protein